ncbi:hypothetical protein HDN1F_01480 [gamma proteobacterium HdN1]|nr:hypothetical protein HDN1F_01480 [gamma proteobacterium HdN1]
MFLSPVSESSVVDASSATSVTLYRAVGPGQMRAIMERGFARFPARLPQQKFFYPMLTESFASFVATVWNVPHSGAGYVLRFRVAPEGIEGKRAFRVGGPEHREFRIGREDFNRFNAAICGPIEVVAVFGEDRLGLAPKLAARAVVA